MRVVLQRVTRASVTVDGQVVGAIDQGFLILIGVRNGDTAAEAKWLAEKIVSNKWTAIPALEEYPVLTDSYAPVERMINPITGKPYSIELEDAGVTLATLNYVGSNALSLAAAILAVFIWLFVLFQRII
ncbi:MAG: D-aminoacyl-tRNA deacylase [Candidatus Caldarchaeum sp.]